MNIFKFGNSQDEVVTENVINVKSEIGPLKKVLLQTFHIYMFCLFFLAT